MTSAIDSSSRFSAAASSQQAALSREQLRELEVLQATDRKVKVHEQAHMAAGAGLVRGSHYEYKTGPDKQLYAVAGEVSIDASPGKTPAETVLKARQVRAAALAPADPSPQDRQVAAQATQMEMQALQEMAAEVQSAKAGAGQSPAIAAYRAMASATESVSFSAQA